MFLPLSTFLLYDYNITAFFKLALQGSSWTNHGSHMISIQVIIQIENVQVCTCNGLYTLSRRRSNIKIAQYETNNSATLFSLFLSRSSLHIFSFLKFCCQAYLLCGFNLSKLYCIGIWRLSLQDFASELCLLERNCCPLHQQLFNLKATMFAFEANMIFRKKARQNGGHNYLHTLIVS